MTATIAAALLRGLTACVTATSDNLRSHEIAPRLRPRLHSVLTGRWSPVSRPSVAWADFVNRWSLGDMALNSA